MHISYFFKCLLWAELFVGSGNQALKKSLGQHEIAWLQCLQSRICVPTRPNLSRPMSLPGTRYTEDCCGRPVQPAWQQADWRPKDMWFAEAGISPNAHWENLSKITFSDGHPTETQGRASCSSSYQQVFLESLGFLFLVTSWPSVEVKLNRSKAKFIIFPPTSPDLLWSHQMWHCYPFIIGLNRCCWVFFFFAKTQFIVLQFWRSEVQNQGWALPVDLEEYLLPGFLLSSRASFLAFFGS